MRQEVASDADLAWVATADPGWKLLPVPESLTQNGFVSGDPGGQRLTLMLFGQETDRSVLARVLFGPSSQGPPGHAHGGSMAAVLDETMGAAAWVSGNKVVAVELIVRFKTMLPLGSRCVVETQIESVSGRKVRVTARLQSPEGEVFAEGEDLFVTLDDAEIQKLSRAAQDNFFDSPPGHQGPATVATQSPGPDGPTNH